ncbi:MAG TPA: TIM barrel protein [Gaiellaceae bacterium]|nr:TIM barrel protein [Gaiellaceae bacterium]
MRVGIDSYSYHRLLGEIRPGEPPPPGRLADGGAAVVAEARALGVDGVALETCYLGPPSRDLATSLAAEAGRMELVFSWGAPNGLWFGARPEALAELLAWIAAAAAAGTRTMRIVVAGPALRGLEPVHEQIRRTVEPLRTAARAAASAGIALAIENHGDLAAAQLAELIDAAGEDALGVCFDTANALRVGDDTLEAVRLLAPRVRMVHLKDVEPVGTATDPVAGPRSVRYGAGVVPLDAVLGVLEDAGFDGLACVEVAQLGPGDDERELVADSVAWLRRRAVARTGVRPGSDPGLRPAAPR